jgi:hypothetical protein
VTIEAKKVTAIAIVVTVSPKAVVKDETNKGETILIMP